ncbi:hypothetical protein GCM10017083_24720 [Thalassobaculum fulvum]|jgi:hypothetical protein|uniref:Uncharacterized protein n=1 Tax=Thalassobaculum fulvum TaxID=1633335 RepID=A0A918XS08_9PROT|nr:hypothetical protein GCM10017083_24720 [Thalassobaculum fulvum]
MRRPAVLISALVAAVVWAVGAGVVAVRQWPAAGAAIERARDVGMRGCAGRYPDPAARERCEILFETQYVMERNIALFTRLLLVAGPLAGIGVWIGLDRRKSPSRRSRRR